MNKAQLKEMISILQTEMHDLTNIIILNGIPLMDNPFIPEYLGFEETSINTNDDLLVARIYSKDGYNISRFVDLDKPRWVVMEPDGRKNEVLIKNMLHGIHVLQACGMNVSLSDYYKGNNSMNKFIEEKQKEIDQSDK